MVHDIGVERIQWIERGEVTVSAVVAGVAWVHGRLVRRVVVCKMTCV